MELNLPLPIGSNSREENCPSFSLVVFDANDLPQPNEKTLGRTDYHIVVSTLKRWNMNNCNTNELKVQM